MPSYVFCDENGQRVELTMTIAEYESKKVAPGVIRGGNRGLLTRDFVAEHGDVAHAPGNWPMTSEALAVHPDQIGEAVAMDAKMGVSVQYTKTGEPIFESKGQRKRYCEAHGCHDLNGGYSDPRRR